MEFRFEKNDRGPIINIEGLGTLVSNAAAAAINDAADLIRSKGAADVAKAGFSRDFSDALEVTTTRNSVTARLLIPFAIVFQYGAFSQGSPLLWIPLPGTPKFIGARKMTAKLYEQEIGPLFYVKGGKYPMLYGYAGGAPAESALSAQPSRSKRLTTSDLRNKTGAKIPLFIGLDSATITKRLHILEICQEAEQKIPGFYTKYALENASFSSFFPSSSGPSSPQIGYRSTPQIRSSDVVSLPKYSGES
jgi:hypothetical protein